MMATESDRPMTASKQLARACLMLRSWQRSGPWAYKMKCCRPIFYTDNTNNQL